MPRQARLDGKIYQFPDDTTNEEMHSILSKSFPIQSQQPEKSSFDQIKQGATSGAQEALNSDSSMNKFAKNLSGGVLNSLVQTLKGAGSMAQGQSPMNALSQISNILPGQAQNKLNDLQSTMQSNPVNNFDAYKTMGTEEKPFNPISGFTTEGAEQLAGELLTPGKLIKEGGKIALGAGKKAIESMSPGKATNEFLNKLGSGAKNTQEASKSIVKDIKTRYEDVLSEPKEYYDFIEGKVGDKKLYDKVDPLTSTKMDKEKNIINKIKGLNVGDLFHNFKSNPTYNNAHKLQSELGLLQSEVQRKGTASREEIQNIGKIRNQLKDDIHSFLDRKGTELNQDLSSMYKTATGLYEKNVVPFLHTKKLRDIVREGKTNVPNVHKIFENPHDIEKGAEFKKGPVNKLLEFLPEETKGKILFRNALGFKNASNPQALSKSVSNALMTNFSHLDTPELQSDLKNILSRSLNKKYVKNIAKGLGVGALLGAGGATEELVRRNI